MSNDSSELALQRKWWWSTAIRYKEPHFGSPSRTVASAIIIFVLAQAVAIVLVSLSLGSGSLDESAWSQFFYVLLGEGGVAVATLALVKRREIKLSSVGLGRLPVALDLAKGLIGFVIFYVLLFVSISILGIFFPELNSGQKQDVGFNNLTTFGAEVLAFISLVILPPLGEEILMRGYLYSGLRTRWRVIPAMLLTSILFGLAHLQFGSGAPVLWAAGLDTFILSLVLVYLRETTGALWAGMLVHMLNNVIAFIVYIH